MLGVVKEEKKENSTGPTRSCRWIFFGAVLCIIYGASYQGELHGKGSAEIGRNGAYVTLAGKDAQTNINFFWIGAAVFFLAAIVQLILAAKREFTNAQPFGDILNDTMMCPKCEQPFSLQTLEKAECPDCQVQLVQLKGFFDKSREQK